MFFTVPPNLNCFYLCPFAFLYGRGKLAGPGPEELYLPYFSFFFSSTADSY